MIAVIDVSGNNLASLSHALERLGYAWQFTHDKHVIRTASHVILPGVGAAKTAMQALHDHGLIDCLKQLNQPLLGICLGMQLLFEFSEEGQVDCLSLIPGKVRKLTPQPSYPVPHMGWNQLQWRQSSSLQQGIKPEDFVYFVHSYAVIDSHYSLATCNYHHPFSAIVQHKQVYGMQFHPEKSADVGLTLLNNFLRLESLC